MKNTRWFRFIAGLLALVMVLTLAPMAVLADGDDGDPIVVENYYNENGEIVLAKRPETYDVMGQAALTLMEEGGNAVSAANMDPNKRNVLQISVSGLNDIEAIGGTTKLVINIPDGVQIPYDYADALESDQVTGSLDAANNQLLLSYKNNEKADTVTAKVSVIPNLPASGSDLSGSYVLGTAGNGTYRVLLGFKGMTYSGETNRPRINGVKFQEENGMVVAESDVDPVWTLTHVTGNYYTVYSNNAGQFLRIEESTKGLVLESTDQASAQKILLEDAGGGYYKFIYNSVSINNSSFSVDKGFASYDKKDNGNNAKLKLYSLSQVSREATVDVAGSWVVMAGNNVILSDNASSSGKLKAVATEKVNDQYMPLDDVDIWTFTHAIRDYYTVRTGNGYLNISGSGISVSGTAQNLLVTKSGDGYILAESANGPQLGLSNNTDFQKVNKGGGAKLTLRSENAILNSAVLILDVNGGQAAEKPEAITASPGTTITLPSISASRDGKDFIGWSTDKDFYSKVPGTNITYRKLYKAGSSYTVTTGKKTLYAVYDTTSRNVRFGIRADGVIQDEPNSYETSSYIGHFWVNNTRVEAQWVIDISATKSVNGYYMVNNVTDALSILPTAEQIAAALKKEGNVVFDPETQYVHWYVLKLAGSDWHVDGVIRQKNSLSVSYEMNVPELEKKNVRNMPGGYDIAPGTGIYIGTEKGSDTVLRPERDGYVFEGWNTEADGSGTTYAEGNYLKLTQNLHLYAQWEKVEPEKLIIYITSNWRAGRPAYAGTKITLTANLTGFENKVYDLQWQYSPDNRETWVDVQGANEINYTYEMNETTASYIWRVVARNVRNK